ETNSGVHSANAKNIFAFIALLTDAIRSPLIHNFLGFGILGSIPPPARTRAAGAFSLKGFHFVPNYGFYGFQPKVKLVSIPLSKATNDSKSYPCFGGGSDAPFRLRGLYGKIRPV